MRLDITVTDALKDGKNLDYLCTTLKYNGFHDGNSETKMQFLKRKLLESIKHWVRQGYAEALDDSELPTE